MSYRDKAKLFAEGGMERAYPVGDAGYPMSYSSYWGIDKSEYSPEFYGKYIRQSNPVYACVTQRADYLSALPLRFYQYNDTNTVLRGDIWSQILDEIDSKLGYRGPRPLVRNVLGTLMGASSPLDLTVKTRQMGMLEIAEGKIVELLRYVNPFWTLNRLIKMTNMALDLWGESYWFIERGPNGRGAPQEIWWAKPTQVHPITHPTDYIQGYIYEPIEGGQPLAFSKDETVRIYLPDPNDEFQPLPPLAAARIYADHEQSSMQANMNLHKQGLHPGAVVTPIGKIWEPEQAQDVEDDINLRMSGSDRAHRWAVFRQEVKLHQTAVTPKDSEFINGMEFDLERVANAYHWPIDLLAGKRTYENIDQALKQAWQTTVLRAAFLAQEITEYVIPMFPNSGVDIAMFDHTQVAVLQESETTRWERERTQVSRVITVNEWRKSRALPPVEGGDRLFVTNQDTPLDNPFFVTGPEDTQDNNPGVPQPPKVSANGNGVVENG